MGTRAPRAATAVMPRGGGSRKRVARRPTSLKRKLKTAVALVFLAILGPLALGVIYCIITFMNVSRDLPQPGDISSFKPNEGTKILYSDGSVMAVLKIE